MEIGQVCVKIAGRDAGLECVVVDVLPGNLVLVDGNTRRRRCNIKHLEPIGKVLDLNRNAGHEDVVNAMRETGLRVVEAKKGYKTRTKGVKPVKKRKALLKHQQEKAAAEETERKGKK